MPSTPLSADRSAVVKLQTRLDVEAIDIAKGRTERPPAVARLVQLIRPGRVDLVDEVLSRIGRRPSTAKAWPPFDLVCELAWRVKRAHCGEMRLRGEGGSVVVDLIRYIDTAGRDRQAFRVHRDGVFVGEYTSPGDLARQVDLATLVEDDPSEPGAEASEPG